MQAIDAEFWQTVSAGGQGTQGRGRPGAQALASHGQMAADLAQRMSDQARSGPLQFSFGQPGADPSQQPAHLFSTIAAWLSRLNDTGGSRSWPNIELPYPDNSNSKF